MRQVFMRSTITVLAAAAAGDVITSKLVKLTEVVQAPALVGVMGLDFEGVIDASLKVRALGIYSSLGNRFNYDIFQETSDNQQVLLTTLAPKLTAEHAGMLMSLYKMNPEIGLELRLTVGTAPAADWTREILWSLDNFHPGAPFHGGPPLFTTDAASVGTDHAQTIGQGLANMGLGGQRAVSIVGNPAGVSDERLKRNIRAL